MTGDRERDSVANHVLDSTDVGIVVFDADERVVRVNDAVTEYLGLDRESIDGADSREFAEAVAPRLEDGDAFVEAVAEAGPTSAGSASGEQGTEHHVVAGDADRWLERRTDHIHSGQYEGGRIERFRDVTDHARVVDRLERRERSLRAIHDVLLDRSTDLDDRLDELLDIARRMLGVDHASFVRVTGDRVLVENVQSALENSVSPGHTIDLQTAQASVVVDADDGVTVHDASERWPDRRPAAARGGARLDYYVGVPVRAEGDLYGVLSFADEQSPASEGDWEFSLLDITASSLGTELARRRRTRRKEEELNRARRQFESLVEDVEDYAIFRLDTGGYVESWNRGAEEIKGYEADEILGEHVRTFYTEADREAGLGETLLDRAAEDGRAVDEGWRVRADGSKIWVSTVLTALRDDDGDLQGYLKVTRDMTEQREREQQVQYERERLEFVNRIIRHNLLNGMNVVEARANLLDGHVDEEARQHLETVIGRVEDMTDLIETMRTFMKAIVEGEEHEPEPTDIGEVLADQLAKADDVYDDATFDHDDLPSVPVLADDLLPEVFENLLMNAVQHNDGSTASVRVETVVGDETVAVRVADDGPGIDETVLEHVFEKGQKGFESPGTGFGLYLVHEIVDSYGGKVEATNRDEGGAAFTVHLPRA
ncbi:PAS domain S-box protein [Haloarchaeobius sp. HRN-SO-5]|uniref:PAS domain S-box protein n=1 Tax=Haloarchaeobius sp. HRN-SO-5 TaxID=3446118 RepID=UPI003EB7514C